MSGAVHSLPRSGIPSAATPSQREAGLPLEVSASPAPMTALKVPCAGRSSATNRRPDASA